MTIIYHQKVIELEKQNQWEEVLDFLRLSWGSDPENLNNYLCYALELWYILNYSEGHLKNAKHIDFNDLITKYQSVYNYGKDAFSENIYFNIYFGYMMYVMPWYFLDHDFTSPDDLGKLGHIMIEKAYRMNPDDPTVKAFYHLSVDALSISEQNSEYKRKPSTIESRLIHIIPIESAIGTYFSNIFS